MESRHENLYSLRATNSKYSIQSEHIQHLKEQSIKKIR